MSDILPEDQNHSAQQVLNIVENVTAPLKQSDTVELAKTGGQTAENIFNILVKSGGKPVAVILAIAVLVAVTAIPIFAWGQIHKSAPESAQVQEICGIQQRKFVN